MEEPSAGTGGHGGGPGGLSKERSLARALSLARKEAADCWKAVARPTAGKEAAEHEVLQYPYKDNLNKEVEEQAEIFAISSIRWAGGQKKRHVTESESAPNPSTQMKRVIRKMHHNLGHPSTDELVQLLREARATTEAIQAAKEHQCDICLRHSAPGRRNRVKMPKTRKFNEYVQIDVNNLKGHRLLNIIDMATKFHVVVRLEAADTASVVRGLRAGWMRWAGPMRVLVVDPAASLIGEDAQ